MAWRPAQGLRGDKAPQRLGEGLGFRACLAEQPWSVGALGGARSCYDWLVLRWTRKSAAEP